MEERGNRGAAIEEGGAVVQEEEEEEKGAFDGEGERESGTEEMISGGRPRRRSPIAAVREENAAAPRGRPAAIRARVDGGSKPFPLVSNEPND